jgi:hypothetical protein
MNSSAESLFDEEKFRSTAKDGGYVLWGKDFPPLNPLEIRHEGYLCSFAIQSNGRLTTKNSPGYYHLTTNFLYFSGVPFSFIFKNAHPKIVQGR